MDLSSFDSDKKRVEYLYTQIEKIEILNECRLFKEEQMQISEELLQFRNCIEWIIQSNRIIQNIKYALTQCLDYASNMQIPIEETENKRLYSYYLEDSVYRDLVLWDMFRQLLNEFYNLGHSEKEVISIFKFLKDAKTKSILGESRCNGILDYLKSNDHTYVRETLRNSFTHSVEATSSYVFHRSSDGKVRPQTDYLLPKHPFINIDSTIKDVLQLIKYYKDVIKEIEQQRENKFALLEVSVIAPWKEKIEFDQTCTLEYLKEICEKILIQCDENCETSILYNGKYVCKPTAIVYKRIHSTKDDVEGRLEPKMTFEELKDKFGDKN